MIIEGEITTINKHGQKYTVIIDAGNTDISTIVVRYDNDDGKKQFPHHIGEKIFVETLRQ